MMQRRKQVPLAKPYFDECASGLDGTFLRDDFVGISCGRYGSIGDEPAPEDSVVLV